MHGYGNASKGGHVEVTPLSSTPSPTPTTSTPPISPPGGTVAEGSDNEKRQKRGKGDHDPEGFKAFYLAYPKHKGKAAATKAWNKLKPDSSLKTQIIADVQARAGSDHDWTKDGGKYVPNPATYLNGRRWEDEWRPKSQAGGPSPQDKGPPKSTFRPEDEAIIEKLKEINRRRAEEEEMNDSL